jgi:uncharacterized repeat protein (TIGR03803 family)
MKIKIAHLLTGLLAGGALVGAAQTFTDLHDFSGPDGNLPVGGLVISDGQLYGVTQSGGSANSGVIYKMDFNGNNFSIIHNLDVNNYMDGQNPQTGMTLANGMLYGTTAGDQADGAGYLFSLNGDGTGFASTPEGALRPNPKAGQIWYTAGLAVTDNVMYGISSFGGDTGYYGSIFRASTDLLTWTNFYSFTALSAGKNKDGANPRCTPILLGNTLYGTAELGGANGVGTLFSIGTNGSNYKVLHTFAGGTKDGGHPAPYMAVDGDTLYGTTYFGGTSYGTIFKINTDGSGYKVLYFFQANGDGGYPYGGVMLAGSTLYGMAGLLSPAGNASGALFSINTDGTGFKTVLKIPFNQGTLSYGNLILTNGIIYGVSANGGLYTNGFAFSIALPAETIPPTLSITNVPTGLRVSNAVFNVSGKAADNVAISNVLVSVDGGSWNPATDLNNWASWTLSVSLNPGTNTIAAYAVDTSGNVSATNTVKLIYTESSPLTVGTNGAGIISPNDNGKSLIVGSIYSLVAKPAKGCTFVKWTDGGTLLTTNATLKFQMSVGLDFVANFLDMTKPTVTITSPKPNAKIITPSISVTGKAADNVGVTGVWYQINNGGWTPANGTSGFKTWTISSLPVSTGTNVLNAYAEDAAGNFSTTNKVVFVRP